MVVVVGGAALALLVGALTFLGDGASAWSLPVTVAAVDIPTRPALVVDAAGLVHILAVDRDGTRGVVRWVVALTDGRIERPAAVLGPADLRAAAVAAAREGPAIRALWVAPAAGGVQVVTARLDRAAGRPRALSDLVEDAGPISVVASGESVYAVWSQLSGGRREVWSWVSGERAPIRLGTGDAPAVSTGISGPVWVWWERTGPETYRLIATRPGANGKMSPRAITGNVSTLTLETPALAHDPSGRLRILYGTQSRGFGRSQGRLYGLTLDAAGEVSERRQVAEESPSAFGAVAVRWQQRVLAVWTDLRSGRSLNPEIYVGLMTDGGISEERLTFTLSASTNPAVAPGPDTALTAAWLELQTDGRYGIALTSTDRPARRRFLLGIPELDLNRPAAALAFALTALIGATPYAALLTMATALATTVLLGTGRAIFADARWWQWFADSERRALTAALALALGILKMVGRGLLPALPRLSPLLAGVALLIVWTWLRRRGAAPLSLGHGAGILLLALLAAAEWLAFPWAALALSQLAM